MTFNQESRRPKITLIATGNELVDAQPTLVHTSKNFSTQAGSFYMHLIPRPEIKARLGSVKAQAFIYKLIKPMDLVSIGFETKHGSMVGFVDNVYKSKSVLGGKTHRQVIVRGRDFGKLLIEDKPRYAPLGAALETRKSKGDIFERVKDKIDEFLTQTALQAKEGKKVSATHPVATYWQELLAPELYKVDEITGESESLGKTWVDVPLDVMIPHFIEILGSFRLQTDYFNKKIAVADIINYELQARSQEVIASTTLNTLSDSSIINHINSVIDKEFYEFWIDHKLVDEEPKMFIRFRPKPWDFDDDKVTDISNNKFRRVGDIKEDSKYTYEKTKTWITQEEHHVIPETDILSEGLGISDYQAWSMYIVNNARELIGAQEFLRFGMNFPIMDFNAITKYGVRSLVINSKLVKEEKPAKEDAKPDVPTANADSESTGEGELIAAIRWRRDRIFNWFKFNPIFESGDIMVKGNEDIRIGDKISMPEREFNHIGIDGEPFMGVDAYVTGVQNVWNFGEPYKTHLTITRGHNKEGLLDYAKQHLKESGILRT